MGEFCKDFGTFHFVCVTVVIFVVGFVVGFVVVGVWGVMMCHVRSVVSVVVVSCDRTIGLLMFDFSLSHCHVVCLGRAVVWVFLRSVHFYFCHQFFP